MFFERLLHNAFVYILIQYCLDIHELIRALRAKMRSKYSFGNLENCLTFTIKV